MRKNTIAVVTASSLAAVMYSNISCASLAADATLNFSSVNIEGTVLRSYFSMDTNSSGTIEDNEKTFLESGSSGLNIGTTQATAGRIDTTWSFFGESGNHTSVSDTTILTDDGAGNVTLDFSGWNMTWNGIPFIELGGGDQNCGTAFDGICITKDSSGNDVDVAGSIDNGASIATLTCGDACWSGDSFILEYSATVPFDDESGLGGVDYTLHLAGCIGAAYLGDPPPSACTLLPPPAVVPAPPAVWLFGSGLIGLIGMARRKV